MNRVFIHNNNLCEKFKTRILYAQNIEIDKYISNNLLVEIEKANPDIIFIKDALTEQYIDLLGLRVAMHIRLSHGKLKYLPVVIVSELNHIILQKLSPLAKILITKNIFLIENTKEAIENFDETLINPFEGNEYDEKFLNLIEVEPPKDYLSHHSIANEWSIYKWSKALSVSTDNIKKNNETINDLLYFKYLVAKDYSGDVDFEKLKTKFQNSGKIVSIDDELDNGWRDIFKNMFKYNKKITFKSLNYDYQDKGYWAVERKALEFVKDEKPDIVLLDLRLIQADHEEETKIEDISGIKILQEIHKINAGIQVIMLTATGKSTILEKLYEYNILGYIKKEHPDDINLNTKDNIEKLMKLVDQGFQRSYLKKIFLIQKEILELNLFNLENENYEKIYFEISNLFNLLDSNLSKKNTFFILAIYNSIEMIVNEFNYSQGSTYSNIIQICQQLDINGINTELSKIICTRNYLIHLIDDNIRGQCIENTVKKPDSNNLIEWLNILYSILKNIDSKTK